MCVILLTVPSRCFAVLRRRFPSPWPQHIPVVQSQRAASQTVPPTLRARAAPATVRRTSPWKHRLPRYRVGPPPPLRPTSEHNARWQDVGFGARHQSCTLTLPLSHPTNRPSAVLSHCTLRRSVSAWQWRQAGLTGCLRGSKCCFLSVFPSTVSF